jgi:hypothetical protein
MTKLQNTLDHAYTLETMVLEYYGDLHQEIKTNRRACFALANELSQTERHLDVLMQALIRRVQDLELELAELADEPPANDQ